MLFLQSDTVTWASKIDKMSLFFNVIKEPQEYTMEGSDMWAFHKVLSVVNKCPFDKMEWCLDNYASEVAFVQNEVLSW